jgi:hypothetical protein
VIYLTLPELAHVAVRTLGGEPDVRDYGLLESALARPQATAFGSHAYPGLDAKAANPPPVTPTYTRMSIWCSARKQALEAEIDGLGDRDSGGPLTLPR